MGEGRPHVDISEQGGGGFSECGRPKRVRYLVAKIVTKLQAE